jgi:hypothetical protein
MNICADRIKNLLLFTSKFKKQLVKMMYLFWDNTRCWFVNTCWHFGVANYLFFQMQEAHDLGLSVDISVIVYQTTLHEFPEAWKLYHPPIRALKNPDRLLYLPSSFLLQFLRPTLKYSQTQWIWFYPVGWNIIFDIHRTLKLQLQFWICISYI